MEQGQESPKIAQIREAARLRLLEAQAKALPSAADMQQKLDFTPVITGIDLVTEPEITMITIGGNTFNPYELDGLILNAQQRKAVDLFGLKGESGCLIGPAGTGKTTSMKAIIQAIILSGRVPILSEGMEHKYLKGGLPGIFGGSFTRIATRNLRDNCPPDIQQNVHTIHRLLEYEPELVTVWDEEAKKDKNIKIFKPTRGSFRSLDPSLWIFLLDESSMIGYSSLYRNLVAAVNPMAKAQFLFIGDIAQLPPVMDDAVLGYKLIEHELTNTVVELTEVYRHAGAIVNLANEIRVGLTIPRGKEMIPYAAKPQKMPLKVIGNYLKGTGYTEEVDNRWTKEEDGSKVSIQIWKNRLDGEVGQLRALQNLGMNFFPKQIEAGLYNPETDMILMPYNKAVGTLELNKYIAQYLGKQRQAEVYEVIAGFNKAYLAAGDKVFFDREEAIITKININALYSGRIPISHSPTLDRWGHDTAGANRKEEGFDDIEALLNIDTTSDEERKNQASHVIHLRKLMDDEDGKEYTINTAAEINGLLFGYALTIHKSQGSQWHKVYCVFHNSHNRNLQRELLYTGITRAQKELYIIAEPETLVQGVLSQHIRGNTLREKAEYFKGKVAASKARDLLFNQPDKDED